MKSTALLAFTAISLAACTTTQPAPLVEQGYQRGALAVAAIDRGDWSTAERKLVAMQGADARDPARLINLGTVYMETGRPGAAMSAWRLALASSKHFMIETRDGRTLSTDVLARQAIARHSGGPQVSAR